MDIFDINNGQKIKELKQFMEILDAIVSNHEKQIKDLAAHLLELRQLVTPMMEFKQPTKICGPNLEETLNAAGFYRKKEWVGLTGDEIEDLNKDQTLWEIIRSAEEILKEKNT